MFGCLQAYTLEHAIACRWNDEINYKFMAPCGCGIRTVALAIIVH